MDSASNGDTDTNNTGVSPSDTLWANLKKSNQHKLRFLPLDLVHVLETSAENDFPIKALESQEKKITEFNELTDKEFAENISKPLNLRCDCCQIRFSGATLLTDMINHIGTDGHKQNLLLKLQDDPLYVFQLNKSTHSSVSNASKQELEPPRTEEPKKRKVEKNMDVPEDYRKQADWIACYACNIVCSSTALFEKHEASKRHQKIVSLSSPTIQKFPCGPYIINGQPTIDVNKGAVKLELINGEAQLSEKQVSVPNNRPSNISNDPPMQNPMQRSNYQQNHQSQNFRNQRGNFNNNFRGAFPPQRPMMAPMGPQKGFSGGHMRMPMGNQQMNPMQKFGGWGPNRNRPML